MKQEDEDLLLKDLCARLPYSVSVNYKGEIYSVLGIAHGRLVLCKPFMSQTLEYCPLVKEVKPCLRPISSMTEKQKTSHNFLKNSAYANPIKLIDFYVKNHFDYRGLIEKGLAIDTTGLNIYNEETK